MNLMHRLLAEFLLKNTASDLEAQALPGDVNDTCIATLGTGFKEKGKVLHKG